MVGSLLLLTQPFYGLSVWLLAVHQGVLHIGGHELSKYPLINVTTEKGTNGGPHLDIHKVFEKLGLTQEVGIPLDRVGDLSKDQCTARKRRGEGGALFLPISSRLACSTLSSAFRFCFFCVRSAALFIRASFEGDARGASCTTSI